MDDRNIIALLFSRSEDGLQALEKNRQSAARAFRAAVLFWYGLGVLASSALLHQVFVRINIQMITLAKNLQIL